MKNSLLLIWLLFSFPTMLMGQDLEQKQKIKLSYKNTIAINNFKFFLKTKQQNMRDSAYVLAKKMNWETKVKANDGSFSLLYGISKYGKPLYYKFQNQGAATTSRVTNLRTGGTLGLNLTGNSIQFAEWDNGSPRLTHSMLQGRVEFMDSSSVEMHATHIAGTIIGNDALGINSQGIAYGATLRAYDSFDDLYEALVEATEEGRLLSNHSYASDALSLFEDEFGKYNEISYWVDLIQEYAPYYLSIWGAGNDRYDAMPYVNPTKNGYDLLSYWNTAKNGIVVGAVHQVNNYIDANSVQMSYFSNYGPTDDGRIKPDITTKGVDVLSCIETSDTAISTQSGTSTATPVVTGTLGLLQEHYLNTNGNYMKAATAKGLILHTADEAGTTIGPDYRFGWGLLNAEKAATTITNNQSTSLIKEITLNEGETYTLQVKTQNTSVPLMASISWTDPAGIANTNTIIDDSTPALVNDLDIRIIKNNTTFFPWKLGGIVNPTNAATQGDNQVDPFEKIEINTPLIDEYYTIRITHKGSLAYGNQDFSLIVTGLNVTCPAISNIETTNITQTTATINWIAPAVTPTNGYEYEVRTSGNPGSGITGLTSFGTVTNELNAINLIGLTTNTNYIIYLKLNCDSNNISTWTSKNFKTCKIVNGIATIQYEENGWSYYALNSNSNDILFGIEKTPVGIGANSNAFEMEVEVVEDNCFANGTNYFIKSATTEATLAAKSYFNTKIISNIKPNGFINIRWMTDPLHSMNLISASNAFQASNSSTQISPIMYLKKVNSKMNLPSNLRDNGLGIYYAVEILTPLSNYGFTGNNSYFQFNNINAIEGTGAGIFIRISSLPTTASVYDIPATNIQLTQKGSIRFNATTNTFEGHNGIDWIPMH